MTAAASTTLHADPSREDKPKTDPAAECYGKILALAGKAGSTPTYYRAVLRAVAETLNSPFAAIYVRLAAEIVQDEHHTGATPPEFWRPHIQNYLTDAISEAGARGRVLRAKGSGERIAFIAAPIVDGNGEDIGAVALALAPFADESPVNHLNWLQSTLRLASFAIHNAASVKASSNGSAQAAATADALSTSTGFSTPEELAFTVTNNLRNKLGCEQVALSLVRGQHVKILSVSGLDHVAKQSEGITRLRAAMEECLDAGKPLGCQPPGAWSSDDLAASWKLHQQWSTAARGDAVVSMPLQVAGKTTAILSLRRRADEPFSAEQVEQIRKRVEPYVGALLLVHDARRGLVRHTGDAIRNGFNAVFGRGHHRLKAGLLCLALLLTWFVAGVMPYRVTAPCAVAPAEMRHLAAPYDGILLAADALQGDHVHAGQILCRLDDRDLLRQQAELSAEITVLDRQQDKAMADNNPVEARLAQANLRLARARLDIVNARLEQAVVRAPFDGVLVAGDLRQRIGGVITRGEPLFQIAPLNAWVLELKVPEDQVDDIEVHQQGEFAPLARPEASTTLTIRRIRPQPTIHEANNAYVVEATAELPYEWLRPGMEGVARVNIGERPVWWVALHGLIDYIELNL